MTSGVTGTGKLQLSPLGRTTHSGPLHPRAPSTRPLRPGQRRGSQDGFLFRKGTPRGRLCLKWLTPVNHEIGLGRKKASDWKRRFTWITLSRRITGTTSSRKLRREVITQQQGWGRSRCSSHPQQEWRRSSHVLEFLFPRLFADPNCFHAGQMRP